MSGDRNFLIIRAFCKNASAYSGILLQLASIINYNAENINEKINKLFLLLKRLSGDGRKTIDRNPRPIDLKANVIEASAATATAAKPTSFKLQPACNNSLSRHKHRNGIKPCWFCTTTNHKMFDCLVIQDVQRRVGQAKAATSIDRISSIDADEMPSKVSPPKTHSKHL